MQSVIELAGLPAEQQRCLRTAVLCDGLRFDPRAGRYMGWNWNAKEGQGEYSYRASIEPLLRRGLLSSGLICIYPTDAGIELYNCGRVARELAA
ncbi:hypothetical protein [Stenotrophomonas sp. MMGLT7]|uniref:hypothetical protein n=1 Tax=Stenotrophomonas sp. MMGLT7 TaxID=2901227 RepID=UPI001E5742B1|nr:hypothetical protein [Stenotrophomonas sp. MMGLT7]MCD7096964.1 hypothetical protein [Stenotrophomonas sp. MMGLT7]